MLPCPHYALIISKGQAHWAGVLPLASLGLLSTLSDALHALEEDL